MQLKFRVYDPLLKRMSFFDLRQASFQIADDLVDNVQQFTGVNDANGQDIYDGDVIGRCYSPHEFIGVCRYLRERGSFMIDARRSDGLGFIYHLGNFPGIQVIGNIHENPDLILTTS